MTYEESSQLMTNITFRGRVKVACLKYADSIMIEPTGMAGHNTRVRWAQQTFAQPEQVATTTTPPTVMDAAVQFAGVDQQTHQSLVDDESLQRAVEAVVQKTL